MDAGPAVHAHFISGLKYLGGKIMPKLKTHSGAKKRFKVSKNGKLIRAHANTSHQPTLKKTKRKRGLRKVSVTDKTNTAAIKRLLPYQ